MSWEKGVSFGNTLITGFIGAVAFNGLYHDDIRRQLQSIKQQHDLDIQRLNEENTKLKTDISRLKWIGYW